EAAPAALPVPGASVQGSLDFQFYRERVEPIFIRPRAGYGPGLSPCATCHVQSGTPLKLQPLQEGEGGRVFWSEEQSRRNFQAASRLVVPGRPEQSRLLNKPLAVAAGGTPYHVGGKFWDTRDDPEWRTLADWVRSAGAAGTGAEVAAGETAPPALDFEFFRTCVQRVFLNQRPGLVQCVHCHGAEPRNFAPEIPEGRSFWNLEESRRNFAVLRRYIEPGFPLMSRFLTHPLAPEAGGDHFHAGGRRWPSQDDPEWRMLAAWVRGEATTCLSY
ncbi:MAG TPA: hypothetical protein VD793_06820, partial [Gemmatimonadales bacterium]|nr:hypothetical protein [Gemmatimonadales bacterium]